jgi:hypothetical protein
LNKKNRKNIPSAGVGSKRKTQATRSWIDFIFCQTMMLLCHKRLVLFEFWLPTMMLIAWSVLANTVRSFKRSRKKSEACPGEQNMCQWAVGEVSTGTIEK